MGVARSGPSEGVMKAPTTAGTAAAKSHQEKIAEQPPLPAVPAEQPGQARRLLEQHQPRRSQREIDVDDEGDQPVGNQDESVSETAGVRAILAEQEMLGVSRDRDRKDAGRDLDQQNQEKLRGDPPPDRAQGGKTFFDRSEDGQLGGKQGVVLAWHRCS